MSSGSSLTRRQRRGATIQPTNIAQMQQFLTGAFDDTAHTVELLFFEPITLDTDATQWAGCFITGSASGFVTSVTFAEPGTVTLHFADGCTAGDFLAFDGSTTPIRSSNGAPIGAFRFQLGGDNNWPPILM